MSIWAALLPYNHNRTQESPVERNSKKRDPFARMSADDKRKTTGRTSLHKSVCQKVLANFPIHKFFLCWCLSSLSARQYITNKHDIYRSTVRSTARITTLPLRIYTLRNMCIRVYWLKALLRHNILSLTMPYIFCSCKPKAVNCKWVCVCVWVGKLPSSVECVEAITAIGSANIAMSNTFSHTAAAAANGKRKKAPKQRRVNTVVSVMHVNKHCALRHRPRLLPLTRKKSLP